MRVFRQFPRKFSVDDPSHFKLRKPAKEDAAGMLELVRATGILELNSCYAYLLMCRDFPDTCVVAETGGELAGFVIGYRPPARPDSLFVWQIGVSPRARRQGLAHRMLAALLIRSENRGVRFLEATVTPSNLPSRRMFESFAEQRCFDFSYHDCFQPLDFGHGDHEPESLIRLSFESGDGADRIARLATLPQE